MVLISKDDAKAWLEGVSSTDKVAVIHDADVDGFTSGLIYYHWCMSKKASVRHFACERGVGNISKMDLSSFDKIIITDVGPNMILDDLSLLKDKDVLYVDHHQGIAGVPVEINEYRAPSDKYFPCARLAYEFTGVGSWLALAGVLGDAGDLYVENHELLDSLSRELSVSLDEYRDSVTNKLGNAIIYFEREGKLDDAFSLFLKMNGPEGIALIEEYSDPVEEEFSRCREGFFDQREDLGGVWFYFFDPSFNIKGPLATILTIKEKIGPVIFATPKGEGFIGLSARDQGRTFNVAEVLQVGCDGLKDANTGGHPFAAGGRVRVEDLGLFKDKVKSFLSSLKK